jgi:hypothetical protein
VAFAISEVGSVALVGIAETASLLGIGVDLVAGFGGTRNACLAAIRGDVDLVCFNFDTIRDLLTSGDLVPLLQVSAAPIAADRLLEGVPVLGGATGLAASRAAARGGDVDKVRGAVDELVRVIGSGRIVVGPAHLPSAITDCLSNALYATLSTAALGTVARDFDVARGSVAAAEVQMAARVAPRLVPAVRDALRTLRQ